MMVALNLMKGLDKLKIPYRFNDFNYIRKNPDELACIIGKTFLLDKMKFKNPILLGASVFSHPLEDVDLIKRHLNIKKILVPGEWMKEMFDSYYPEKVISWPVGIDTNYWHPSIKATSEFDFLIYDKVRWNYEDLSRSLIGKIKETLDARGFSYTTIRYMHYEPHELKHKISKSKYCIFLVEHETQGLAYQQILSTGTPIIAWDQQKFWLDPQYFPSKVQFGPVSAVPYWDSRCGEKFQSIESFERALDRFIQKERGAELAPRDYILENLTLEKQALEYLEIVRSITNE